VSIKRLNYFTHQFLREQDFKDEQKYHIEMRRLHNQTLYGWGVVRGLEVKRTGEREITISPGFAIDRDGRELVLTDAVRRDLSSSEHKSEIYITIGYAESWDEVDRHSGAGVDGFTRVTESPEISESKHQHTDGSVVTLAKVVINEVGHVHEKIEMGSSVRKEIGARGTIGWVRLPFKPIRLYPLRIEGKAVRIIDPEAERYEFIVDEFKAYCDENGARGSMGIPVPPGATRIVGFRIAGTASGDVRIHLYRTGWNLHENRGEDKKLLMNTVHGPKFHHEEQVTDGFLDESHTVSVAVEAERAAEIWLVAARFE